MLDEGTLSGDPETARARSASADRFAARSELGWGIALVGCVLVYRPLGFWAENAWDLASPLHPFLLALIALAAATLLLVIVSRMTGRVFTVAIVMGWGFFLLLEWKSVDEPAPFLAVAAISLAILAGWLFLADVTAPRVVGLIAIVTVVAPTFQVVLSHLREQAPFPIVAAQSAGDAVPSGKVEDALLLIVDGYPMETVAREWLGHDTRPLIAELNREGFVTPSISWSHNTFTALAIPSMLEGGQVVDMTSTVTWRNRRSVYEITRGSSVAVEAFQTAGFEYVAVESGWDGDECWAADRCIPSSFSDESFWTMMRPSAISDVMSERWGSGPAQWSAHTVEALKGLDVFGDGAHQFVYAHLLLPHPPYVVDEQCDVLPEEQRSRPGRVGAQLACVDRMVMDILSVVPKDTAVVISGDHGSGTRGQVFMPPEQWDDLDVAERLGAFLAYRLPDDCDSPERDTNVYAMRALLECSLDMGTPFNPAGHVLGGETLGQISLERLDRIDAMLADTTG